MKSTRRRIVNAAIDYDSCGHNAEAKMLVLWLITNWGDVVANYFKTIEAEARKILTEDISAQLVNFHHTKSGKDMLEIKYYQKLYKYIERQKHQGIDATDFEFACAYNNYYNNAFIKHIPQILNKIFVLANQNAIDYILQKVEPGDTLLITSFSNRVNKKYDGYGIYERASNSCFSDLLYFTEHMRSLLKDKEIEVCLNPITRTDIEAGLPVGENFKQIIVANQDIYPNAIYDKHKVTLLFTILLNLTARFPEHEVLNLVFDDAEPIIQELRTVFSMCSQLFTTKTHLLLIPYVGEVNVVYALRGEGSEPELNYRSFINYLIRLASYAKDNSRYLSEAANVIDIATLVDFKEIAAMRAMQDHAKRHEVKIGIDQLYTPALKKLLIYIVDQFSADIFAYHANEGADPSPAEKILAAAKTIDIDKIDESKFEQFSPEQHAMLTNADDWFIPLDIDFIPCLMLRVHEAYFNTLLHEAKTKQCIGIAIVPCKDQLVSVDQLVRHLHDLVRYLNFKAEFDLPFTLDRLLMHYEDQKEFDHEPVMGESEDIKAKAFNNLVNIPSKSGLSKTPSLFKAVNAKENADHNGVELQQGSSSGPNQ